ncbi:unnamed protein product [Rhizophagus irregularis]|nr:unnamed protein product [Rhizophagus irregularis]CAB4415566.1 unnamed protein product [Rhizophagus irregularis]
MTRAGPLNVTLKRLDSSQNISSSYINQWNSFLKRHGESKCCGDREEFIPKENLHGGNLIIKDERMASQKNVQQHHIEVKIRGIIYFNL